ncbi:MAG: hypothetical protein ACR2PL_11615 [Dehalococcoidia bacterium]
MVVSQGPPPTVGDGVATTSSGAAFVADPSSATNATGSVRHIQGGASDQASGSLHLGSPAGVALSLDAKTLLISSLADDGSAQILIVDLPTGGATAFNATIGSSRASGGLHRAFQQEVYAWVDSSAGPTGGKIFLVK